MSATDGPSKSTRPTWGADRKSYSEYLHWKLGDPLATLQTLFLPLRWFLAFSTFTYPQSLIIQANNEKVPLEDSDFPRVEDSDSAHVLSSRILQEWSLEQERIKAAQDAGKQPRTARRALLWVIVRVFGPEYALATLAALGETLVKILEALLLGSIIRWLTGGILDSSGYLWAGLLSLCAIWHGFLHHWLFYLSMRCGFRMRVGFISTIYRKALNLSITHTSSTGYITNLVSNDVQRFEDAGPFFFFILLGPLEAIISVGIAYTYIGVSSLVGFAILMLSIPLQSFFARQFGVLRRKTVKERDERIKTTSDALAGMMVIKLYACWWTANEFGKRFNQVLTFYS
jgi:ATP-binding cassette subfamily C (CFTR/MRP) protein 4